MLLDPDLLRSFVAIVEAGGLTAAGKRLGLTQSGVSVRLRRLEEALGRRLLERSSRGVAPTADGAALLGPARRMLELNAEIARRFAGPPAAGPLRAGIADYVAHQSLAMMLARFRRLHPGVALEIRTGLGMDLAPLLDAGDLDVVVAGTAETRRPAEPLLSEPLVWCAARGWSRAEVGEGPLPLAMLPAPCSHRAAAIRALEAQGRSWRIVYVGGGVAGVRAAVEAGLGIAALPLSAVGSELRRLDGRDGMPDLPRIDIGAFMGPGAGAPGAAFVAFFRDASAWSSDATEPTVGL